MTSSCNIRDPGIWPWFSDRSNCSHWSFETDVLLLTLTLHWSTYHYASTLYIYTTIQPTLLTTTVLQGVDNHNWVLRCHHCYHTYIYWVCSSWVFHFLRWLEQLNTVLTKDGSPHTGYTFTSWVGAFSNVRLECALSVPSIRNFANAVGLGKSWWRHQTFRVTGHLWGGFTAPRWIPRTKSSDAEFWCFLWSAPE